MCHIRISSLITGLSISMECPWLRGSMNSGCRLTRRAIIHRSSINTACLWTRRLSLRSSLHRILSHSLHPRHLSNRISADSAEPDWNPEANSVNHAALSPEISNGITGQVISLFSRAGIPTHSRG